MIGNRCKQEKRRRSFASAIRATTLAMTFYPIEPGVCTFPLPRGGINDLAITGDKSAIGQCVAHRFRLSQNMDDIETKSGEIIAQQPPMAAPVHSFSTHAGRG